MSILLPLGLLLFTGTHLVLALAPNAVATRRAALGDGFVKGTVAVLSAAGLVLIVLGWRGSTPQFLYAPVAVIPALVLIGIGIYLVVLSNRPSVVKRTLRHPQLTGVLLWCAGHLLLNGDSRSLLLFGWLAVWAALEMLLINRRDGARALPEVPPLTTDLATVGVAILVFAALIWAHPWLAGVAALRGL